MNWERLAEPQADGSDIDDLIKSVEAQGVVFPTEPPAGLHLFKARVFDNLDFTPKVPNLCIDTTVDQMYMVDIEELIGVWPAMRNQVWRLLTGVYPVAYLGSRQKRIFGGTFGTRGNSLADFGQLYATTGSKYAFCEGLVASLANWKLYAVGLRLDAWDDALLLNEKTELVEQPLRSGEMQPIGVTLHATYAMNHVLDFYTRARECVVDNLEVQSRIQQTVERIQRGWAELDKSLNPTPDGVTFFTALRACSMRLLEKAL